jgi:large subunit ribosomal protein L6
MSRIGKKPVGIPKGVTVTIDGLHVKVKGPRGELSRVVHSAMTVAVQDSTVVVTRPSDEAEHKALHGLTRTLVSNMIEGVTAGFRKQLDIVGVGYKAETRPYGLQLALGFSHPVDYRAPTGIKLSAPQPTSIVIEGANKEVVGQVAAELRSLRPPEPYKG